MTIWLEKTKSFNRFHCGNYRLYEVKELSERHYQYFSKFLTVSEKHEKKYHAKNRKVFTNYILERIFCKFLVSRKFNLDFVNISILTDKNGAPCVYAPQLRTDIKVSISHSGNMIFIACSSQKAIGIDCQELKSLFNCYKDKFMFTSFEREIIKSKKSDLDKLKTCTLIWSIKESFVKLQGKGFKKAPSYTKIIELKKSVVVIKDEENRINFLNYNYDFFNGYCLVSIKNQ